MNFENNVNEKSPENRAFFMLVPLGGIELPTFALRMVSMLIQWASMGFLVNRFIGLVVSEQHKSTNQTRLLPYELCRYCARIGHVFNQNKSIDCQSLYLIVIFGGLWQTIGSCWC